MFSSAIQETQLMLLGLLEEVMMIFEKYHILVWFPLYRGTEFSSRDIYEMIYKYNDMNLVPFLVVLQSNLSIYSYTIK